MARALKPKHEKNYNKLTKLFMRRNFAVEQERKIKETELNTEIAIEENKTNYRKDGI
jgi:hypothetical protein